VATGHIIQPGGTRARHTRSLPCSHEDLGFLRINIHVVFFLQGNSLAPEFYMPTFWNTLFHLHRRAGMKKFSSYLPAYEDGTECSETSAYKIQTPGNYPEESIQHSEHDESLKSRIQ